MEQLRDITSFETEVAALSAAITIHGGKPPPAIYTDSKGAMAAVSKTYMRKGHSPFEGEVAKYLRNTNINWIRSHPEKRAIKANWTVQERGNSLADELACGSREADVEITYEQLAGWTGRQAQKAGC